MIYTVKKLGMSKIESLERNRCKKLACPWWDALAVFSRPSCQLMGGTAYSGQSVQGEKICTVHSVLHGIWYMYGAELGIIDSR